MTPEEQKAYYVKNKADSDKATKADMEKRVAKEQQKQNGAGEAAVKNMSEGRMDTMGTPYKKGGAVAGKLATRGYGCAAKGKK